MHSTHTWVGRWRTRLYVLQIIGTMTFTGLMLNEVRWGDFGILATNMRWDFVGASAILVLLSHLINVARWQYFLRHSAISYSSLLALYGVGLFSSNFLPTGIGGDGVRALLASHRVPLSQAIVSVVLDRAVGLVALSALFVLGLCFGLPPAGDWNSGLVVALRGQRLLLTIPFVVGCIGLLGLIVYTKIPGLLPLALDTFAHFIGCCNATQERYGHWLRLLCGGYGLSVISHLGIMAAHWAGMQALGIDVSSGAAVWLVLAGSISLLMPIAVNGLGLQEGTYVVLLACYGVPTTAALSIALLVRSLMVFFSLLGGLYSLRYQFPQLQKSL